MSDVKCVGPGGEGQNLGLKQYDPQPVDKSSSQHLELPTQP